MPRQTLASISTAPRRRFVKLFVLLTLSSGLSRWSRRAVLADAAADEPGIFNVDITLQDFEALHDPGNGSVIASVPAVNLPPIIITRVSDQISTLSPRNAPTRAARFIPARQIVAEFIAAATVRFLRRMERS